MRVMKTLIIVPFLISLIFTHQIVCSHGVPQPTLPQAYTEVINQIEEAPVQLESIISTQQSSQTIVDQSNSQPIVEERTQSVYVQGESDPSCPQEQTETVEIEKDRRWSYDGEQHEVEEVIDSDGCVHEKHKWIDVNNLKHELQLWTDHYSNAFEIEKWEDGDGCFHEVHKVTDAEGKVQSVHYRKDQHGVISEVESTHNLCVQGAQGSQINHSE